MYPGLNLDQFPALFALYAGLVFAAVAIGLLIVAAICYLVYNLYKGVPVEHQEMDPAKVWFLLIPCVPLVFNFWVYPGLARSLRKALSAKGITVDDSLEKVGLWYSITTCLSLVPCVGYLAAVTTIVLFVIFLVKGYDQKKLLA